MKLCQFILPGLKALHTFYTCSNLSWIPCTGSVYSGGGVRVFKGDRRREMEDVITLCSLLCVCVCCRPIAWKQLCRRLGKKRKCMMIEYPPPQPSLQLIAFQNVYWSAKWLKSLNPADKLNVSTEWHAYYQTMRLVRALTGWFMKIAIHLSRDCCCYKHSLFKLPPKLVSYASVFLFLLLLFVSMFTWHEDIKKELCRRLLFLPTSPPILQNNTVTPSPG